MDHEIRNIGPGIYMVAGKVIWIKDGVIDADTDDGRRWLVRHAMQTWADPLHPLPYGDLTCDVISRSEHGRNGTAYLGEAIHFGYLPEETKEILRKEFPDHASEI